ncbi:unnamed protein product [Amoebophrya sp. A120]|nr:unnamed protein product [Amoebophrya sp. A120]|eukprot:GSA120T00020047001.1
MPSHQGTRLGNLLQLRKSKQQTDADHEDDSCERKVDAEFDILLEGPKKAVMKIHLGVRDDAVGPNSIRVETEFFSYEGEFPEEFVPPTKADLEEALGLLLPKLDREPTGENLKGTAVEVIKEMITQIEKKHGAECENGIRLSKIVPLVASKLNPAKRRRVD